MSVEEYAMWNERATTGRNVDQLEKAYEDLMKRVKRVDPLTLAEVADGTYKSDGVPRVQIQFLHSWLVLDLVPYRIRAGHAEVDTLPMKVLLLLHLVAAAENQGSAVRVMNHWVDCRSLQHGALLGSHFAATVGETLNRFFAMPRKKRIARVLQWGGKPAELGEEGYVFKIFPRLPVGLAHWFGDEEFPPYSKVLYDVSASNYMPTHGIVALTEFLVHRLAEEN
jgi:hypothetical protein